MKYLLYLIFPLLFSNIIAAQKVAVFEKYTALEKEVLSDKNTIYVVNFWATWCAPCVKELPHFEKLNSENKSVKVVLVSLDFKNQFETKLLPFLKNRKVNSEVVLLTDKDYNTWLPIVDKDWSGSIPATLIIKNGKRVFAEKTFSSYEELNEYVNTNIN
ncbi:TlpA family protein disulfide reductase [Flavobacterium aestivum]|uniref:TlpA family protein disulfide reductase n=1 Tax=Flavobacterium aestivum TaxID=3003257 RepID=UPI0022868EE6|nr:TlpA disulfide reductase family protein [Flavobacterium aestivum]